MQDGGQRLRRHDRRRVHEGRQRRSGGIPAAHDVDASPQGSANGAPFRVEDPHRLERVAQGAGCEFAHGGAYVRDPQRGGQPVHIRSSEQRLPRRHLHHHGGQRPLVCCLTLPHVEQPFGGAVAHVIGVRPAPGAVQPGRDVRHGHAVAEDHEPTAGQYAHAPGRKAHVRVAPYLGAALRGLANDRRPERPQLHGGTDPHGATGRAGLGQQLGQPTARSCVPHRLAWTDVYQGRQPDHEGTAKEALQCGRNGLVGAIPPGRRALHGGGPTPRGVRALYQLAVGGTQSPAGVEVEHDARIAPRREGGMARRVLLVHTGGTLGMDGTPLVPGAWASRLIENVPELRALADVEVHVQCNLDSSDMGPAEWTSLVQTLDARHADVDGFVIVHGTDTLAWTASALAFAIPRLDRPIVLTGAQRPLARVRTDARRNLVDATEIATHPGVGEVCVCFDGLLLRGCRASKNDAEHYRAFDSPGTEPLGRLGVHVELGASLRGPADGWLAYPTFDARVQVAWVGPGTSPHGLADVDRDEVRGIVLMAFGVGNVPLRTGWPQAIERLVARGIDVLVCSQAGGAVDFDMYENGRALAHAGALSGGRMRVEAATAKLMHGLARFPDRAERHAWLMRDVAGEQS